MKTVPRPTTSSVFRGWNGSSTCMQQPVKQAQVRREREPVDVEQRQDVDQHVVGREPPAVAERPEARGEVGVRVDDPLGPAGRARAVEHQAGVVAVDRGLGETALGGVPGLAVGHQGAQLGQRRLERLDDRPLVLPGHHDPRAAVLEEVTQLVGGEPGIQRQARRPRRRASPGGPPGTAASPAVTIATRSPGSSPSRRIRAAHRAPAPRARRRSRCDPGRRSPAGRLASANVARSSSRKCPGRPARRRPQSNRSRHHLPRCSVARAALQGHHHNRRRLRDAPSRPTADRFR